MKVRILRNGIMHPDLPDLTGMVYPAKRLGPGLTGSYEIEFPAGYACTGGSIKRQIVRATDVVVIVEKEAALVLGYPDGNPKSLQGAKKYSLRYLPLSANIAVNQALEDGAKKYGPANWREKGVAISVYIDAALRHISQFYDGKQDNAADSGAPNLGHAMACMAIVIDAMAEGSAIDDRPFAAKDTDALLKRPGV